LLAEHHVETAVAMGEDSLPLEPCGCPCFGVVRNAYEVDEAREHGHGVIPGLQEAWDDGGFVNAKQPRSFVHGR